MKSPHKHHIIPKYHCEELGIDPDFDDNFVTIERIDHAQIHWEYYNGGYKTLLKYIKPKPYVLINIPFGDKRDVGAATGLAKNEIDGIVPVRGNDHPDYIPVLDLDGNEVEGSEDWSEKKRHYYRTCVSKGIQPKTHEERAIIRKEKELAYKRGVEERKKKRKKIREEKEAELLKHPRRPRVRDWIITFPDDRREIIRNLAQFCREHNLHQGHMNEVAKGKRNHHKGYKVEDAHEERVIIRKEKVACENNKTRKAASNLYWYHKKRKEGLDPNKKYREAHREENKSYAKWYYHNVQKPKNAKRKAEKQGVGTLDAFLK